MKDFEVGMSKVGASCVYYICVISTQTIVVMKWPNHTSIFCDANFLWLKTEFFIA